MPDGPRGSAELWLLRSHLGGHAFGFPGERTVTRRGGGGERGDVLPHRGRAPPRDGSRPAGPGPRTVPGDDEQPPHRRALEGPRILLLRDNRGRGGSVPVPRWNARSPHAHDEHPQHSSRSDGARVPATGRGVPADSRIRRARDLFGRGWDPPGGSLSRGPRHGLAHRGPTPQESIGGFGWGRRTPGPQPPWRTRSADPEDPGENHEDPEPRRSRRRGDAGRRRMETGAGGRFAARTAPSAPVSTAAS